VTPVLNPLGLLLIVVGLAFLLVAAITLRTNYSSSLVIRRTTSWSCDEEVDSIGLNLFPTLDSIDQR